MTNPESVFADREVSCETPWSLDDLFYFLNRGARAGLTTAEAIAVIARSARLNELPRFDRKTDAAL